MADGFVQHHAWPARAEHDVHFTSRCGHGLEIHQRLADGLVDRTLPGVRRDEALKTFAAAKAVAAGFLPIAFSGDNGNVDAHQRTDVAINFTVRAQDFHHLPARGNAGGDLPHALILTARIGIDRFQQFHLRIECRCSKRIVVAIKFAVGAARRVGVGAAVAIVDGAHRFGCACQCSFREIGGVRIANRFGLDRAQAKTLRGVIGRLLEPAIVEGECLGLAIFQEQFAIVSAVQALTNQLAHFSAVEPGAVDQRRNSWVHKRCSGRS